MIVRIHVSPSPLAGEGRGGGAVRSGLSLLEVMAALAIFLFSLVALNQLVDIGSANAQDIDWLARASLIAQSRMAEVLAGSIPLSSQSDSSVDEDPDWNWSMDAEGDTAPGLWRVKITVSRERTDGSRFETVLNQMVLDPTYRGAADGSDGALTATAPTMAATGTTGTTGSGTTGAGMTGGTTTGGK
jgi:general secretion pathway protein I